MVDATVDNKPVSIQLKGASTTVPSNETWVVHISVGNAVSDPNILTINGNDIARSGKTAGDSRAPQFKMTLTGGDSIAETNGGGSAISIQGFVVDS